MAPAESTPMWSSLLWVGPEAVAREVQGHAAHVAAHWHVHETNTRSAPADGDGDTEQAADKGAPPPFAGRPWEVVVDASTLTTGGAPAGATLRSLTEAPPPSLRRLVTVTTTAWLGDPADPQRAGAAALAVAGARSLALRLAPRATVNTLAIAGAFDPARAAHAALAAQPDAQTLAHWLAYLCDPANDYVTGQTLNLCGGATLLSSLSV